LVDSTSEYALQELFNSYRSVRTIDELQKSIKNCAVKYGNFLFNDKPTGAVRWQQTFWWALELRERYDKAGSCKTYYGWVSPRGFFLKKKFLKKRKPLFFFWGVYLPQ